MSVMRRLSEAQEASVLKDLNTSHKRLDQDVAALRQWLVSQYHLPPLNHKKDDNFLKAYLVASKLSLERCKEKLDAYFTMRGQVPEIFANRDPLDPRIQRTLDANNVLVLPKTTPEGCRVLLSTTRLPEADRFDVLSVAKRILSVVELRVRSEYLYAGDFVVLDSANFGPGHVLRLRPDLVRLVVHLGQEIYPTRIKGLIFINSPPLIEITVNRLVKPFLKKKLADRIFIYSEGGSALLNHFPREMLPKDYGGDEDTLDNLSRAWAKEVERNREWFKEESKRTTIESKRTSKTAFSKNPYFGVEGSLRTLNID